MYFMIHDSPFIKAKTGGALVAGGSWVFPSMPKGEIVGKLIFIDVNNRGSLEDSISIGYDWRSIQSGPIMVYL